MEHIRNMILPAVCAGQLLTGCAAESVPAQTSAAEISQTVPVTEAVTAEPQTSAAETAPAHEPALLHSADEIALHDTDGQGKHYLFTYNGTEYSAEYTPDNWKIIDSYQIRNAADMTLICQALADEHPVHGADLVSYRTAEDMAYEWQQHNIAYQLLSEDSPFRNNAKDVDINPADQGKSVYDLYVSRTGNADSSQKS